MKDKIQVTMPQLLTSSNAQMNSFLKALRSSIVLLLMVVISNNNYASIHTPKNLTDSNIIDFYTNLETGDDLKNVKISMPDTKLFRRADREINRNMANEIKDLKNFKLIQPESNAGDFEINAEFYEQYKLINFYIINQLDDDKTSSEFYAFNIDNNFIYYAQKSDNELNKTFIESYKIHPVAEYNTADAEINFNFFADNN